MRLAAMHVDETITEEGSEVGPEDEVPNQEN